MDNEAFKPKMPGEKPGVSFLLTGVAMRTP